MKKTYTILDMKKIAESRNGECLSEKYSSSKLKWRCKEGHIWKAVPGSIVKGHWCPDCAGNGKKTINEMKELAKSKGGKCLSVEYINDRTKLNWRCGEGHEWMARPNNIKSGSWCPYCSHSVKLTLEEMKQIAKSRDGVCLSNEYVNSQTKLKWQCKKRHEWEATPGNIKKGSWCPICSRKRKK